MRLSLLQKRGDIYHFRWTVPLDLRPIIKRRELTKSLNTPSKIAAISAASCLYALVERTITVRRQFQAGKFNNDQLRERIEALWSPIGAGAISSSSSGGYERVRADKAHSEANWVISEQAPIFSQFYKYWLAHKIKNGLSTKLRGSYARLYSDWDSLMLDQPLSMYRKKEIREFLLALATTPKRNLKQYKGKGILELLELEIPSKDRVASKTVDEARKWLQGVFSLAVNQELISSSPAVDLKLQLGASKPFGNFSDEQVLRMMAAADSENGWKSWIIWIAAFTGMRRGEIVQLRKRDIRFDSDSKRHYIQITDVDEGQSLKSPAANRKVPIHKQLTDRGFLDFVNKREGRIFPDLAPHAVTRWFNSSFMPKLRMANHNDQGQRLVFHSFRHSLITKALSNNKVSLVQEVVGHQKQQIGITSRYNHARPIADLLEVIDCIEYG